MVRAGYVIGLMCDAEEIELKVQTGGGPLALVVSLYPEDEDWSCECSSRSKACEHVAASIIAVREARAEGLEMPAQPQSVGRLVYRLSADDRGGLRIARMLAMAGDEQPLTVSLTAAAAGQTPAPPVAIGPHDLDVEQALGMRGTHGAVQRQQLIPLLKALASCEEVRLGDDQITCAAQPVLPHAVVEDAAEGGFRVQLLPPPGVDALFSNGAVLLGGVMRPRGELELPAGLGRELASAKHYAPADVPYLVTHLIPQLKRYTVLTVNAERLPGLREEAPRMVVDTRRTTDDRLEVFARLVYGEPETAEIVEGKLHMKGRDVPVRDVWEETRLVDALRRDLGLIPGHAAQLDGEEAVSFAAKLKRWHGDISGRAHESWRLAPPLVGDIQIDGDSFDITFQSSAGRADPGRVMAAWRRGSSLAPLDDDQGWAPIPSDLLALHGHMVTELLEARDEEGKLPRCMLPDLGRLCDDLEVPGPPSLTGLRSLLGDDFEGIPSAALPDDLQAELRDYQRQGVDWLAFMRSTGLGALLADDMGLGKTLQALCVVQGRTLVVAPTSVVRNWQAEAGKFRPGLSVSVYHGANRKLDPDADLILTTYALLRLDIDMLSAEQWDMVVLDEAQAIKNPGSQVAQAAYRLRADFRLTLTGTPVENRLDELWSQFHLLNRGLLGGRESFRERYGKPIAAGEAGAASRLRTRIRPFLLRRLKSEVAKELPPRTDVVLHVTLDEAERTAYDAIRAATRRDIVERMGQGANPLAALAALMRLRQAACHRALVPGQVGATGSSKISVLMEVLDEAASEGHKALVFSQWTSLLDLVEPHLEASELPFIRLDGSTRDRQAVVDEFQSDDGPPVMLISLRAGGTGLNLTAADHVFLLDPWWNPAVEDQAADRAHRIGQERPVLVHRLVAEGTVEERILALQDAKRALADVAVGGATQAAAMTRDDLLALLA